MELLLLISFSIGKDAKNNNEATMLKIIPQKYMGLNPKLSINQPPPKLPIIPLKPKDNEAAIVWAVDLSSAGARE